MTEQLGRASGTEPETSLLEIASVPLRRWRVVIGVPLVAAVVVGAISLVVAPSFTATTAFVTEANTQARLPSSLGGLAGLAGQLGVSFGGEPTQSPRFYGDVVKSRELLERVLLTRYPDSGTPAGGSADSATLLHILRVRGQDRTDSLERAVKKLTKLVSVRVDNLTNIVRLSVEARHPELAAAVASRIVEYLNEFNAKKRQSQARERRKFIELRLTDADQQLHDAEDQLKGFYQRNRSWQQAPELVFEEGRLRRRVDIRQEVSLTLRREYETARIEEVNDTPVITVIDPPVPPHERSSPKRLLLVLMALFLGGVIGVVWAFGAEHLEQMRRGNDSEYQEFRRVAGSMREELARLWPFRTRRNRS